MKRFFIQCSVEDAGGSQTFIVEAKDEADAIRRYKAGEGEIDEHDVEVTHLGEPECAGEVPEDYQSESQSPSFTAQEISTLLSALRIAITETTDDELESEMADRYTALIKKLEQANA